MSARAAVRLAQAALGVLVVALAARAIVRQWETASAYSFDWALRPGWIALALGTTWLCYTVLIEGWRRAVLAMGDQLRYLPAARIWTVASLGKYLPGKVWATVGAATMARAAGVSPGVAVPAALLLQGLAVASGLLVVAVTVPAAMLGRYGDAGYGAVLALTATTLAGIGFLAWPRGLAFVVRVGRGRIPPIPAVPPRALALGFAANVAAWLGYGLAFTLLARGLFAEPELALRVAIGSFTASYLAGLLALFAAGGIGVRESMLVLLLSESLGVKFAVALAIASRLLLTVAELGAALPFLLFGRSNDVSSRSLRGDAADV